MEIKTNLEGNQFVINVTGRLDTNTAPALEEVVNTLPEGASDVILDMEGLEYVSSAGLRVILSLQKAMNQKGSLTITHVCDDIKEVFDITGFSDILTIK